MNILKSLIVLNLVLMIFSSRLYSQQSSKTTMIDEQYNKEIRQLISKKKIANAFNYIDQLESRSMEDLIYLTQIPAPPFQEAKRGVAFKKMLEEAIADSIWIDETGNVIALRKGKEGARTVVLDAHLDTVFPEGTDVSVKYRGDTLFAPGIGDDSRGLIVVLTVLRAMNHAGITTRDNIWIVGSVGEEGVGDLRGLKYLFRDGAYPIDSWISVDGGGIDRISNEGLGSLRYLVKITGAGGHSWGDFGFANPHHVLGVAIANFENQAWDFTSTGPKTSYNIGRIGGGTSVNSIPYESWMEVDMRSEDPQRLSLIDGIFKRAMNESVAEMNLKRRKGDPLTIEIDNIGSRPSGKTPLSSPLVQRGMASISSFGVVPNPGTGSTNSNIPISKGIPAITIGVGGRGGGAHSLDEWWLNKNGTDAMKSALLILVAESGFN